MSGVYTAFALSGTEPFTERITSIDVIAPLIGGILSGILYEKLNNNYLIIILLAFMLAYYRPSPFIYGVAVGMLGFGLYRFIKKQFVIQPASSG